MKTLVGMKRDEKTYWTCRPYKKDPYFDDMRPVAPYEVVYISQVNNSHSCYFTDGKGTTKCYAGEVFETRAEAVVYFKEKAKAYIEYLNEEARLMNVDLDKVLEEESSASYLPHQNQPE